MRRERTIRALALAAMAAGAFLAGSGGASSEARPLPTTEAELVATVKAALIGRDLETFESLVNWDGARAFRKRVVSYHIRYAFGRPIRSIALEPFPPDGLREAEASGKFRLNMPVTHRLRVVFDEEPGEDGAVPTSLFLVGKEGDHFRLAVVVPVGKRAPD